MFENYIKPPQSPAEIKIFSHGQGKAIMSDQDLQAMDETKQQSREAATISPFKVPSSEKPGLFANAPRDSPNIHLGTQDPNLPAHCQGWGMGFNFNRARRRAHDMTDSTSGSAPEVDGDQPSACFTTFAGVTLDQALPGQLSAFHILGDDGDAETESDEWNAMANEVGGPENLSGFRLSRDLIITCAHFTNWEAAGNNVQCFLNGQNGGFEAIQKLYVGGQGHKNRFTLRLWAIQKDWDIAIFRITQWPAKDHQNCIVQKEDIYFATPGDRHDLIKNPRVRCWSIGYNLASNLKEFQEQFVMFLTRRHLDDQTKILQKYELDKDNPPESEFLMPNARTVSFGTNIRHPSNAKYHQECVELSAWEGRSGSMVCTEKDGKSAIIGIIQGGERTSDYNLVLLFNTEMTEWWNAATDIGEGLESDPQAISRRCVMG
ncbi:hypothetical protein RBB50_005341 [Rhinocladiella similis]